MNRIKKYLMSINGVSHLTLNPKTPGVVRIHLVPPAKLTLGVPWAVIINGQDILPINSAWAILLREFIEVATPTDGDVLSDEEIDELISQTLRRVQMIFPKTKAEMLLSDLHDIIDTLADIALGKKPAVDIGYMTLNEYAKYLRAPFRMDLMISSMVKEDCWNCNQKCMHCYAGTQPLATVSELTTEEWKKIIDTCRASFIPQLTFTGGEPTMRDDLVELVKYASWFVTRLNTNGVLLSGNLCEELYEASLDSVQITLYSSNPDIHNLLVGANHFNETVQGIKNALDCGLNVSINTPLCTLNKDYLATIKFCESLGVKYFSCSGLILSGNALSKDSQDSQLSRMELGEILTEVVQYCHEQELDVAFTSPGWLTQAKLQSLKLTVPVCGACLSNMAIAPNGTVIPCQSALSGEGLGNLLQQSWKKIWTSPKTIKIRQEATTTNALEPQCLLAKSSGGDCR